MGNYTNIHLQRVKAPAAVFGLILIYISHFLAVKLTVVANKKTSKLAPSLHFPDIVSKQPALPEGGLMRTFCIQRAAESVRNEGNVGGLVLPSSHLKHLVDG